MTACYRQARSCGITHPNEPGHIVQPECSTTVEDSTFLFSFHTRKRTLWRTSM